MARPAPRRRRGRAAHPPPARPRRGRARRRGLAADREPAVRLAAARVLTHGGDRAGAAAIFAAALALPDLALQAATDLAAQDDERGTRAIEAAVGSPALGPSDRAAAAAAHR